MGEHAEEHGRHQGGDGEKGGRSRRRCMLRIAAGEVVVEKCWASGFFKTNLDQLLRDKETDSIVVTGLTTSGCVRATAVDGLQYEYRVVVPREAVGDRNLQAHEANLFDLHAKYADVMALQDVLDAIKILAVGQMK